MKLQRRPSTLLHARGLHLPRSDLPARPRSAQPCHPTEAQEVPLVKKRASKPVTMGPYMWVGVGESVRPYPHSSDGRAIHVGVHTSVLDEFAARDGSLHVSFGAKMVVNAVLQAVGSPG